MSQREIPASTPAATAAANAGADVSAQAGLNMGAVNLTGPPLGPDTLIHPIEFFEQRSHFTRLRRRLDGDHLLRQYFAWLLEAQCGYANDTIRAELRGLTDLKSLHWDEQMQDFKPAIVEIEEQERPRPAPVRLAAAGGPPRVLLVDPCEPLECIKADQAPDFPHLGDGMNDAFRCNGHFYFELHSTDLLPGNWHILAFVDPADLRRLRNAIGAIAPPSQGMTEDEWLLRHAFNNRNVRENSGLASSLARLPMLFARSEQEGRVRFEFDRVPKGGDYVIPSTHWLVAVLDTAAYLRKRH